MKKFIDAFNGLNICLKDKAVITQIILGIIAIIGGIIIKLDYYEWLAFIICIFMVISSEVLNSVIEDIESTESRFKRLSNQIDYSTIYIDMHFAHGKDEGGIILPDVKESWNTFISNIIAFFWGLLKVLFYIVIFGIPLIALAAFFFWLLFGKVGLLVKLFKKLKK